MHTQWECNLAILLEELGGWKTEEGEKLIFHHIPFNLSTCVCPSSEKIMTYVTQKSLFPGAPPPLLFTPQPYYNLISPKTTFPSVNNQPSGAFLVVLLSISGSILLTTSYFSMALLKPTSYSECTFSNPFVGSPSSLPLILISKYCTV